IEMLSRSVATIERRARSLLDGIDTNRSKLDFEIIEGTSMIGGGSTPGHRLSTRLISVGSSTKSASQIEARLRANAPPILTRVESERVLIDLRTVFQEEEAALLEALQRLAYQDPEP